MTREEHLKWCKKRALKYVDAGDGREACMSMLSDLGKHSETVGSQTMGAMLLTIIDRNDLSQVRRYIVGFN